jgi:hypothetical protein
LAVDVANFWKEMETPNKYSQKNENKENMSAKVSFNISFFTFLNLYLEEQQLYDCALILYLEIFSSED